MVKFQQRGGRVCWKFTSHAFKPLLAAHYLNCLLIVLNQNCMQYITLFSFTLHLYCYLSLLFLPIWVKSSKLLVGK